MKTNNVKLSMTSKTYIMEKTLVLFDLKLIIFGWQSYLVNYIFFSHFNCLNE